MTHGSLFSGIGGFDLAAEWMGWENKFHCEWNEFGQRVLKHYWPQAELFTDITKSDFTKYANKIDVLTGGFPCQPYSMAGKRLGKDDERHLWPQMLRAIREIQPTWVVGENVLGIVNWNGGLVFEEVQADLEAEGYEVQPYVLPACAVNASHRRDRVWFVANSRCISPGRTNKSKWTSNYIARCGCDENIRSAKNNDANATDTERCRYDGHTKTSGNDNAEQIGRMDTNGRRNGNEIWSEVERCGRNTFNADVKHTNGIGQEWGMYEDKSENAIRKFIGKSNAWFDQRESWHNFPTQSPICSGDDGLPGQLDGITFSKWRNESIKAYGNAVVPQVVYQLFKTIELMNDNSFTNHD